MSKACVTVGDKVQLKRDRLQGTIRFVGNLEKKAGVWYGVELTKPVGDSDGRIGKIRYFKCKRNRALFVRNKDIAKSIDGELPRATVGDRVRLVDKKSKGKICFIGELSSGSKGTWFGIDLNEAKGEHNGSLNGRSYFECKNLHGVFVRSDQFTILRSAAREEKHSKVKRHSIPSVLDVTVGDTVQLHRVDDDGEPAVAVVKFVGSVIGKRGIFFGLSLKSEHVGKNKGVAGGVRYFNCQQKQGLFVRAARIEKRLNRASDSEYRLRVGDYVFLKRLECRGVVRFIGYPTSHIKMFGIELDEAKGRGDGQFHSVQYFDAKHNCALYLRESELPNEVDLGVVRAKQVPRLSLSHSLNDPIKHAVGLARFEDYCVRYEHVHDEKQDKLDNIDVEDYKELEEFGAHRLLNLFDKANVTMEEVRIWTSYNSVVQTRAALQTAIEYVESNPACPEHIKLKLRMVTKLLIKKPRGEYIDILLLLSSHSQRCNVMKHVAVCNSYGALTNSLKGEMHKRTLEFQVRKVLRDFRVLLVEKLFHSMGLVNNTHTIAGFHNELAPKIGVRPYHDKHISQHQDWIRQNLDKRYFSTVYTKEVIVEHVEQQIEEHNIAYQKVVDFLKARCPKHIDSMEFLQAAIDIDTGKISPQYLHWILAEIGVLQIKSSDWKPIEKCWLERSVCTSKRRKIKRKKYFKRKKRQKDVVKNQPPPHKDLLRDRNYNPNPPPGPYIWNRPLLPEPPNQNYQIPVLVADI